VWCGAGGGGGIDASGRSNSWGATPDNNQVLNADVLRKLRNDRKQCGKKLAMRVSGGGGGGIAAFESSPKLQFGGGFSFDIQCVLLAVVVVVAEVAWSVESTCPLCRYTPHGGKVKAPKQPSSGVKNGEVTKTCRKRCLSESGRGGFYDCFCTCYESMGGFGFMCSLTHAVHSGPCIKAGFLDVPGQSWANKIQC